MFIVQAIAITIINYDRNTFIVKKHSSEWNTVAYSAKSKPKEFYTARSLKSHVRSHVPIATEDFVSLEMRHLLDLRSIW